MTPRCHDGCVYACRVAETLPPREACDDPELVALVAALEADEFARLELPQSPPHSDDAMFDGECPCFECARSGAHDDGCACPECEPDDSHSEHERRAGEERAEREYARMHGGW